MIEDCLGCGRTIILSRGCVRIERAPGQVDAYHPACAPKEPQP